MTTNPYQFGPAEPSKQWPARIRGLARYQRWMSLFACVIMLAYLAALVLPVANSEPSEVDHEIGNFFATVGMITQLLATPLAMLLGRHLHGTIGLALGILTLTPCLGMIVLVIFDYQATRILESEGLKVGLFGAFL